MVKISLLATTALVLCVSSGWAGRNTDRPGDRIVPLFVKTGIPMHVVHGFPVLVMGHTGNAVHTTSYNVAPKYRNAIFDNIDWKDKNQEWLSYYGFAILASAFCSYQSSQSHFCFSETGFNAFPFTGTGKKAKKIGVPLFSESGSSTEFNVGIYSATPSGLPGSELAGGSTTASDSNICCTQLRWVNVKQKLNAGQEYFIAVSCGVEQDHCDGGWLTEESGVDYWHMMEHETYNFGTGTHTYNYSAPWHASTALGPSEGAAIIK